MKERDEGDGLNDDDEEQEKKRTTTKWSQGELTPSLFLG